jgi:hypothetical protein
MRTRRTLFLLPLLLAAAFGLTACPSQTNISKINANPSRYMDKEVGIVGRVTDSYGVPFVGGAYELDDGTGKIWVIAERAVPARGSRVEAKGHVITGFVYHGRNLAAALRETGRKAKDSR